MCFIINLLAAEGMVKINPCDRERERCLHTTAAVSNDASAQFGHAEGGFKDPKDTNPRQTVLQEEEEGGVTKRLFAEERKTERQPLVLCSVSQPGL